MPMDHRAGELSEVRGAQWGSGMTAGPQPASSGNCGGCKRATSCAACGSASEGSLAATQALGWGLLQAERWSHLDQFWRTATVADALRTAPGRATTPPWESTFKMVEVGQHLANVLSCGESAGSSTASLIGFAADVLRGQGRSAIEPHIISGTHGGGGGGGGGGTGSPGHCCPDPLVYPTSVQREREVTGPFNKFMWNLLHSRENASHQLQFRFPFKDSFRMDGGTEEKVPTEGSSSGIAPQETRGSLTGGDPNRPPAPPSCPSPVDAPPPDDPCQCECCRFMQLLIRNDFYMWTQKGGEYSVPDDLDSHRLESDDPSGQPMPRPPLEDCQCNDGTRNCDGSKPRFGGRPGEFYNINCYGDRDSKSPLGSGYSDGPGDVASNNSSGCHLSGKDDPYVDGIKNTSGKMNSWLWVWQSVGLIIDTCKEWKIMQVCTFDRKDWGKMDEFGVIHYLAPDPGEWTSNCSGDPRHNVAGGSAASGEIQSLVKGSHDNRRQ
jgi:hypothetical protein